MNLNLKLLERNSTWIALAVFVAVILLAFQGIYSDSVPSITEHLNTEYKWSIDISNSLNIYPYEENGFIEGHSCAYMPLYFLVTGNLMKVFGTDPIVGKAVSVLAAFGIALLIYKIGTMLTKKRLLSIVPGVLFLLFPVVIDDSARQVKIDMLGLFFSTLSLYLVFNRKYLWSVPFAVLAFFTKQLFIVVPIVTVVYLFWMDRKVPIRYAVLYMSLIGIGFGVGQIVSGGTFFTHTVMYMFSPDFGKETLDRTLAGTLVCLGYLTPVILLAVYGMWKTRKFGLLGVYFIVALVEMVFMIGKEGSGTNYTFQVLVGACCLSSLVLRSRRTV